MLPFFACIYLPSLSVLSGPVGASAQEVSMHRMAVESLCTSLSVFVNMWETDTCVVLQESLSKQALQHICIHTGGRENILVCTIGEIFLLPVLETQKEVVGDLPKWGGSPLKMC